MCFIGGWRDFFLIRDKYLFKGFFSFIITAAILFFLFDSVGCYLKDYPWYARIEYVSTLDTKWASLGVIDMPKSLDYCELVDLDRLIVGIHTEIAGIDIGFTTISYEFLMYLAAAFTIGLFSTFANGCPMRQHVMAASGNLSALCFLLGFYSAIIVFEKFLIQYFDKALNL